MRPRSLPSPSHPTCSAFPEINAVPGKPLDSFSARSAFPEINTVPASLWIPFPARSAPPPRLVPAQYSKP